MAVDGTQSRIHQHTQKLVLTCICACVSNAATSDGWPSCMNTCSEYIHMHTYIFAPSTAFQFQVWLVSLLCSVLAQLVFAFSRCVPQDMYDSYLELVFNCCDCYCEVRRFGICCSPSHLQHAHHQALISLSMCTHVCVHMCTKNEIHLADYTCRYIIKLLKINEAHCMDVQCVNECMCVCLCIFSYCFGLFCIVLYCVYLYSCHGSAQ